MVDTVKPTIHEHRYETMSTVELTENSTHEDIVKVVDQLVENHDGDEKKGDAQKIAEERDEPVTDTSVETDSDSKDTAEKGDETGDSEDQAWLDDDLKNEVAAYGIDEKEIVDFTSREELERALRFFDRSALEAGRKAMAEGDTEADKARDEQGRFKKKEPESESKKEESKEGQYEITLDKDEYGEDLVDEFKRMRDYYESRIATHESRFDALENRFAEADTAAEEQRFDSIVDSLGHADLFGKSGKENDKELQRREDLFVAVKAQIIGLQSLGRPAGLDEVLVNRVARMVFAEQLGKKDLKDRTRKVFNQANGRMGGSATKAHDSPEPLKDEMRRLYKELADAG